MSFYVLTCVALLNIVIDTSALQINCYYYYSKDLEYSILVSLINVLWYLSGNNTRQNERDEVAENSERAIMMYSQTCP